MESERQEKRAALVVIDMQNAMIEAAHRPEELLERIGLLLERARAAGAPVLYLQQDGDDSYEPMKPGAKGWRIYEGVAPGQDDAVLRKRYSDSFYDTPLNERLRDWGIEHLVIAGMNTDECIDATSRSARVHGYDVTLVRDAHTTVSDEVLEMMGRGSGPSAAQIVAHHNHLLASLHYVHPNLEILVKPAAEISFTHQ